MQIDQLPAPLVLLHGVKPKPPPPRKAIHRVPLILNQHYKRRDLAAHIFVTCVIRPSVKISSADSILFTADNTFATV